MSASGWYGGSTRMFVVGFVFGLVAMFAAMTWGTPIATASNSLNDPAIVTESGPLKGVETAQINEYLGIPYAAPPEALRAMAWSFSGDPVRQRVSTDGHERQLRGRRKVCS